MKRIPIPEKAWSRYQKLEAVRRFLKAEQNKLWQYMDNLIAAEQIQVEEINALVESIVEDAGYDPSKVEYLLNDKRKEIIILTEDEDEGQGQDSG